MENKRLQGRYKHFIDEPMQRSCVLQYYNWRFFAIDFLVALFTNQAFSRL